MYLNHFRLDAPPFSITPDTAFAFASRTQQEALATLLLAVQDGAGFIKLTGEVGTGKTLACRRLLAALNEQLPGCDSAYIPNPCLSARSLLLTVGNELGVTLHSGATRHSLLTALNEHLLARAAAGCRVVVCLDEAQAMPRESLEALRLVSNLETEKRKLIQVVLFGQPELDARLAQPDMRQLASRISFHYALSALSIAETERYIAHRLRVAGHSGAELFSPHVTRLVHRATRGVPRLINIVAHKALLLAYGEGALRVTPAHVQLAACDTPSAAPLGVTARISAWFTQRRIGALS
jgi:MSHA biogenesis protein MshM